MAKRHKTHRELPYYAAKARQQGIAMARGINGGGWLELARKCGALDALTKSAARTFLRSMFGMPADRLSVSEKIGREVKKSAVNALAEKLTKPMVSENSFAASDEFLRSYAWRKLRMEALKLHGARCQCCGATPATGAVMNVDHIKPRRLFPHLALVLDNLQVLCHDCNHGKGNWDQTDWRPAADDWTDAENVVPFLRSIAAE